MPRILRLILYVALFFAGFLIFLYWSFPYESLKDRLVGAIEEQLGSGLEVSVGALKPYWFTGVDVSNLTISEPGGTQAAALVSVKRLRARASLLSLIVGSTRFSFDIEIGKGEISGSASQTDELVSVEADFDEFDVGSVKLLAARTGLNVSGVLNGSVDLSIDKLRPLRSTGNIRLDLVDFKIAASQAKLGEMVMPLPDLVLTKGRGSQIKMDIGKGTVNVDTFRLADGDLGIDLKGKAFLATKIDNYRLNLTGSFRASQMLGEALPFLFIVDKEKQADGSYPLAITGRLVKPTVKIGNFTVPL